MMNNLRGPNNVSSLNVSSDRMDSNACCRQLVVGWPVRIGLRCHIIHCSDHCRSYSSGLLRASLTSSSTLGGSHFVVRAFLLAAKNVFGGFLVVVGIAMLVFPGQGLLTIAIGLVLMDFPGKFHVERWIVTRKLVFQAINWLRRRAGQAPLVVERSDG